MTRRRRSGGWRLEGSGRCPSSAVLAAVILPADSRFILPAAAEYRPGCGDAAAAGEPLGSPIQQVSWDAEERTGTGATTRSEEAHSLLPLAGVFLTWLHPSRP